MGADRAGGTGTYSNVGWEEAGWSPEYVAMLKTPQSLVPVLILRKITGSSVCIALILSHSQELRRSELSLFSHMHPLGSKVKMCVFSFSFKLLGMMGTLSSSSYPLHYREILVGLFFWGSSSAFSPSHLWLVSSPSIVVSHLLSVPLGNLICLAPITTLLGMEGWLSRMWVLHNVVVCAEL